MQADKTLNIGRDRLFNLLGEYRLLVPVKRAYHKTTNSHHRFYRHPNLLKPGPEQVTALEPEQVWVADITYLPLRSGTAYLSLVTDACSRKIVGYHVGENLQTENVVKAFRQALRRRKTTGPLVHHSDRGLQYCSVLYQSVHERNGITCSMTDGYDCYQNALAERINGILKNEFLLSRPDPSIAGWRHSSRAPYPVYISAAPPGNNTTIRLPILAKNFSEFYFAPLV